MKWTLFFLILLGTFVFVGYAARSRQAKQNARGRIKIGGRSGLDALRDDPHYWGVRLETVGLDEPCHQARELMDKSLLINHAPELPVGGCTNAVCTCRYVGLPERRTVPRREQGERRTEARFESGGGDRREQERRAHSDFWNRTH